MPKYEVSVSVLVTVSGVEASSQAEANAYIENDTLTRFPVTYTVEKL